MRRALLLRTPACGVVYPLVGLCLACGGTEPPTALPPPPPPLPPVASIAVRTNVQQLVVLTFADARAVVSDAQGTALDVPVTWESTGPVGQPGLPALIVSPQSARFLPTAVGAWTLVARVGNVTGSATVTAEPRQPSHVALTASKGTLSIGEEVTATARTFWPDPDPSHELGVEFSPPLHWSTSAHLEIVSTNATTGTAVLRGVAPGDAMVTVRSGTRDGSLTLVVRPGG